MLIMIGIMVLLIIAVIMLVLRIRARSKQSKEEFHDAKNSIDNKHKKKDVTPVVIKISAPSKPTVKSQSVSISDLYIAKTTEDNV